MGDRIGYAVGTTGPWDAFLVFTAPSPEDPLSDTGHLTGGWLLRDGALRRLDAAERHDVRDPRTGFITGLGIEGIDSDGRRLTARGTTLSRFALETGSLCVNTFVEWDVDGRAGHGEDQDVWSIGRFAERRRAERAAG